MFIDLTVIQKLFADCETECCSYAPPVCLGDYAMLKNVSDIGPTNDIALPQTESAAQGKYAPPTFFQHILYIATNVNELTAIFEDLRSDLPLFLLYFADSKAPFPLALPADFPKYRYGLLQVRTENIKAALLRLQEFFQTQHAIGMFADSILEILFYENGIQAMLDRLYPAFGNPITVFDAGYHLLAASWEELGKLESGRKLIEHNGFTEDDFELINHLNHIHEKVKKSPVPLKVYHPEVGYEQLLFAINTQKDLGHIVIVATNRPFTTLDEQLLILLGRGIDQQMKKDEFIRNNRGDNREYFLRDLLEGKIATGKENLSRLDYLSFGLSGKLYCLVIETVRSSSTLNTLHIRNLFESAFPDTQTLMYDGKIVVLLCTHTQTDFSAQELARLNEICEKQGLFGGLSNRFNSIVETPEYYHQALRAIELGIENKNEPSLFIYKDYYFRHLANIFMQKESAKTFCHPKLRTLMDYDRAHDTDLAGTLYAYLTHKCTLDAAAASIFIHRNTMLYRLKKINSLTDIDYDDHRERQYLILSYELCQMNPKD